MKHLERLSIVGLIAGVYQANATSNMRLGVHIVMIILPVWFLLITFYLLMGPFYLNALSPNAIFKKSTYDQISAWRMTGAYLACMTIAFMLLSMLRIFWHEGGRQWLLASALVALLILVTTTIQYLRKKDTFYLGIAVRMALLVVTTYVILRR
ncbi:hypothetical protein [Chryseolinea soli]|uniref:Uncharacterized protein n=1 Tax=Chryseolinea soli TaxID=2321403 RepID=A0A385SGU2_9BACT|nr:hypothetical protein [Chryseolinea soli]AYB30092.1 hypothetical protein D4L85_05645 [Chryseolinea soli]